MQPNQKRSYRFHLVSPGEKLRITPRKHVMRHFRQADTWGLGLYAHTVPALAKESFQLVHSTLVEIFERMGLTPTFFSFSDPEFRARGKFTKWNGKTHRRIVKSGFDNVALLSFAATESGSEAPAYDSFAYTAFSQLKIGADLETTFVLVVTDEKFSFGTSAFEQILSTAACLQKWEFGFAIKRVGFRQAESIVLGYGTDGLTEEEDRQSKAWYKTDPSMKSMKLRDIFPYLILNKNQIEQRLSGNTTLGDMLLSHQEARLSEIPGTSLFLWKGSGAAVNETRAILKEADILV